MKHIQKIANGRKISLDVETGLDQEEYFVHLAKAHPSDDHLKSLVAKSWKGLKSGFSPTLCEMGVGGTYFMKDECNRMIGVFKPQDEEMGCLNNPKGFTPKSDSYRADDSARRGVQEGEAAFRECAAYVLDHGHFSGVPATDLVVCNHPCFNNSPSMGSSPDEPQDTIKIGSFQEFKEHDFDAQDISPKKASRFPVKEVHKIAILDIRLFNTDRHGGNILVRKVQTPPNGKRHYHDFADFSFRSSPKNYDSDADENGVTDSEMQFQMDFGSDPESDDDSIASYSSDDDDAISFELIPIDHGYTLPHTLSGLSDSWFEWLNWPQAKVPFDEETRRYIAHLDADKDIALLRERFQDWIRPECYKVLKITTMWLKIGARCGLTPYEIGQMMCRKNVDLPSDLERMCKQAEQQVQIAEGGNNIGIHTKMNNNRDMLFFDRLAEIMERTAVNKCQKDEGIMSNGMRPASRTLVFVD
jgi:hypothetical protein